MAELLEPARREFAEKIGAISALRSTRLVDALASVPREDFVGPGPWRILRLAEAQRGYELTPDDDPRRDPGEESAVDRGPSERGPPGAVVPWPALADAGPFPSSQRRRRKLASLLALPRH